MPSVSTYHSNKLMHSFNCANNVRIIFQSQSLIWFGIEPVTRQVGWNGILHSKIPRGGEIFLPQNRATSHDHTPTIWAVLNAALPFDAADVKRKIAKTSPLHLHTTLEMKSWFNYEQGCRYKKERYKPLSKPLFYNK